MEDYQDLMKALDVAIARERGGGGGVDTTRLGGAGGSDGGFLTNWVLGHTGRFAAPETGRAISDFFSWCGSSGAHGPTRDEVSRPPRGRGPVGSPLPPR